MSFKYMVLLLALCATCAASAQKIYKSIGPDGKVVYSDQPLSGTNSDVEMVHKEASASQGKKAEAAAPSAQDIQERKYAGAKKAARVKQPSTAHEEVSVIDPALEKVVLSMMLKEELVRQTEDLCVRTLPISARKYSDAASAWRQRNASLLSQQRKVISEAFSASEVPLLKAGAAAKVQITMSGIAAAPAQAKISWCDKSAGEINAGELDFGSDQNLVSMLKNYQSRYR